MSAPNIVDEARAIVVNTLNEAADTHGPDPASRKYLKGMADKVSNAEAVAVDSYLVLDCVIAAIAKARGEAA